MEHKLIFYPKKHLVVICTYGVATIEGFKAFAKDLLEHANWVQGMTILADHWELNFSVLSTADVENFRHFIKTNAERIGNARIATIVKDISSYGIARMWEIPLEDAVTFAHRVFYSSNDAKAWLGIDIDDKPLI
jgi:hypothetical protein